MSAFVKKYPAISMYVLASILGVGMLASIIAGVVPSDSILLLIAAFVFHSSQAWFGLFMDPDNLFGPTLGIQSLWRSLPSSSSGSTGR